MFRRQEVDRRVTLEITDLGEFTLAIFGHFEPLGDDAVVVAHQQWRSAGEQINSGHVGIGGIDLHDIA